MRKNFVRQKSIHCGKNRKQIKIYNYSDEQQEAVKGKRNGRKNVTPPKQQDLNDKNSKEFFGQLVLSNFVEGDYILHATYSPENLPKSFEAARKSFYNFMKRVEYRCGIKELPEPKFINVTERGESSGRIHHHCFLQCQLSRDEIENIWIVTKGSKKGERLGYINVDRLQGDLDPVIGYVAKDFDTVKDDDANKSNAGRPKNQRRWTASQNLTKPQESNNDNVWSRRELEKAAKNHSDDRGYWERRFPGWTLVDGTTVKVRYNDETGWSLDIKLKRKAVAKK